MILHVIGMLYMFFGLAEVCDGFFGERLGDLQCTHSHAIASPGPPATLLAHF